MLLSEVLWTIHIFSWAAGGQIPWCTMSLSLVWRVYEQHLSEWANGLTRPILRQWHWSGQCEVHRVRVSWPCHCGRGQHYVPRYLCSPVPMFPEPMFPGTYVPRYRCSPVPMFPEPMFPGTYVPRYLCSPNLCSPLPTFPDLLQMCCRA